MKKTENSQKQLRGYLFTVEIYGNKEAAIFRDAQRNYVPVIQVGIPREYRNNPLELDKYMARIHRLIMLHYELQHKVHAYQAEFLAAAQLSPVELASNVGLINAHLERVKEELPKSLKGKSKNSDTSAR